jgi:V8-like Glu-specific endopeptidase
VPYYGGDSTWIHGDPIEADCTSGFDTIGRRTGNSYMLTAGHCADVGDKIDTNFDSPQTMGTVTNKRFVYGGLDAETIGGSYLPYIWRYGSNIATVIGSGDVAPGEGSLSLVTVNGSVTGEHRKLPVVASNQCVSYPAEGAYTCYIRVVSGFAVQGGDSGGPVYQYSSNGQPQVFAAGTIDGSDEADNETFVEQIIAEESYFNVDIATG